MMMVTDLYERGCSRITQTQLARSFILYNKYTILVKLESTYLASQHLGFGGLD